MELLREQMGLNPGWIELPLAFLFVYISLITKGKKSIIYVVIAIILLILCITDILPVIQFN
jgi:hypothetical protein